VRGNGKRGDDLGFVQSDHGKKAGEGEKFEVVVECVRVCLLFLPVK